MKTNEIDGRIADAAIGAAGDVARAIGEALVELVTSEGYVDLVAEVDRRLAEAVDHLPRGAEIRRAAVRALSSCYSVVADEAAA